MKNILTYYFVILIYSKNLRNWLKKAQCKVSYVKLYLFCHFVAIYVSSKVYSDEVIRRFCNNNFMVGTYTFFSNFQLTYCHVSFMVQNVSKGWGKLETHSIMHIILYIYLDVEIYEKDINDNDLRDNLMPADVYL